VSQRVGSQEALNPGLDSALHVYLWWRHCCWVVHVTLG
jgi:hypothetical protein